MPDIKLNFINHSNDRNQASIVIFQKNEASTYQELAVAWKVIKHLGQGWNHPITYTQASFVSASDSWGNNSPVKVASEGLMFQVVEDESGDTLIPAGPAPATDIEVLNSLQQGAITANIYKDGSLLATEHDVDPGQKAVFRFSATLWIGVGSQIEEGQVMGSAVLSNINTQLSLFGIKSADVVMSGGGPGPTALPFEFTMENIVYA